MNTIQQINLLYWVTIIEHLMLFSWGVFLIFKRLKTRRSFAEHERQNLRELISELQDVIFSMKPKTKFKGRY